MSANKASTWTVIRAVLVMSLVWLTVLVMPRSGLAVTDDHPVVVSMGDSYSSGEGVEPFYGQESDNKYWNEDWLAHRSQKAWSGQLVVQGTTLSDIKDNGWYFVASSGAECRHITSEEQNKPWSRDLLTSGEHKLEAQSNIFLRYDLQGQVDYVTLTIGGNDLGFADIVTAAFVDFKYVRVGGLRGKLRDSLTKFKGMLEDGSYLNVYNHVLDEAGDQAVLIVAGYPRILPERGIGRVWCSVEEAALIRAACDAFDSEICKLIESTSNPRIVFVDVRPEFNGHEAAYINDAHLGPLSQELNLLTVASAYSMHPNALGQEAYARAVQRTIDRLEAEKENVPIPEVEVPSELNMALVFDVSGSMGDWSAASGVTKLESAKRQSMDFVSSVSGSQGGPGGVSVRVGVSTFSDYAVRVCGLSNDPDVINGSIDGLQTYNMTNIYAGLDEGISQLAGEDGEKLIVLLSDGLSNEGGSNEDIIQLAREAGQLGIRVYTIGFGSSGDLDEDLLREIADITGGAYAHEDSSDISAATVGLFAQMMSAQLQATSQVLMDTTGAVAQGGTSQVGSFDVTQNGTVTAYLYWPGSVLDLQLTDPNGVVVDEGYAGCTIDTTSIPTRVTVENARQGTWGVAVYGRETSMAEEPFYVAASFNETEAPVIPTGSGAATDNGTALLFLLAAVGIASVTLVVAMSKRRG